MSLDQFRSIGIGALAGVLLVAGGCDNSGSEHASPSDRPGLLTKADVSDLQDDVVVSATQQPPDGAPSWACGGIEDNVLLRHGWRARVRMLSSEEGSWAIYSAIFSRPGGGATRMLSAMDRRVRRCIKKGDRIVDHGVVGRSRAEHHQANLVYESRSPKGAVEAWRGYVAVDDQHLVQVTVVGTHRHRAPAIIGSLLTEAVDRAS